MVGELGRIFRTADGGATWERQDAGTKRPFLAMSCLDAEDRVDRRQGRHRLLPPPTAATPGGSSRPARTRHVFALEFPTAKRGHGAGDFGTMVHTEDGGATWTTSRVPEDVKLPESALDTGVEPGDVNLYGLSYGDPDHAWVVGRVRRSSPPAATAASPGQQQATPDREHALRRPLHRRPARLGGRSRFGDPAHRGRRAPPGAQLPAPVAGPLLLRRLRARAAGLDRRRLRARCSRAPTAAPPGSSSRCPSSSPPTGSVAVAGARRARSRRRLRGPGVPRRRRQPDQRSAPATDAGRTS